MKERKELKSIRTYVPGKPIEEVQKEFGLKSIIKLASNENALGTSRIAKSSISKKVDNLNRYPDGSCFDLIKRLSRKLGVKRENLIIGNGSDEILVMIALAYLNSGEEVIISCGTFSEYEFASQLLGAKIIKVPLKDYCYDIQTIIKKVTSKTKIIFLANPNNPTGTIFTEKQLKMLLIKVKGRALVVLDEAYGDYVVSKEYPRSLRLLENNKNIIVLRTFSKAYSLAGLRIGYGIASKKIISNLYKVRQPFNVNSLSQYAALSMLGDKKHVKLSRKMNEEGKRYLYKELKKLELKYIKTQANFIFILLKANANNIFKKLLKEGVIVRPLFFFGFPRAIRVTIGTNIENRKFIDALKRIKINLK